MGKNMVWGLSIAALLGVMVACQSSRDDKLQVRSGVTKDTVQNSAFARSSSRPGVNGSKGQQGQQASGSDVAQLMEIQHEGDNIFNQGWAVIWKQDDNSTVSPVNTIFRSILLDLQQLYRADGAAVTNTQECVNTPTKINLQKISQTRFVLMMSQCQHPDESLKRVEFEKLSNNNWKITYLITDDLPESALGISLKILKKPVVCQVRLNTENKIEKMDCTGLGQNRTETEHVEFKTFIYSKVSKNYMLQLKGTKYKNLQEKEGDIDMLVPVVGDITLHETVITLADEQAPAPQTQQAVVPAVAPSAAAAAASPGKDSKKSSEISDQELLKMIPLEDRQQYDLLKPEEQQQMLQIWRKEKAQADQAAAQVRAQAQQTDASAGPSAGPDEQIANPAENSDGNLDGSATETPEVSSPQTPIMSVR